jgi:translation elongation factor P/translation initiation factor 5A
MVIEKVLVVINGDGNNLIFMNNISYSAVVLDEKSRQRLIERFKSIIPQDLK